MLNNMFGKILYTRVRSLTETRHYSHYSLFGSVYAISFWNTIDISNDKDIMCKLWDYHISKMSHLSYYLSEGCVECIINTPRGRNYLKWRLLNGEPIWFEYGICDSNTRYDIHYPSDFDKCPKLRDWLIDNGKRFIKMYERDKNL